MRDLAENAHGRGDLRESVREMAENPHGGGEAGGSAIWIKRKNGL